MVKQFDIITVDLNPSRGREKNKYRPCLIISNDLMNKNTPLSWIFPITNRPKKFPSDIILKTNNKNVEGIIDTVQIRALDLTVRNAKVIDTLHDSLKATVLKTIEAHTEMV
ncbi:growth inhibitor PemK [Staphylococcus microti]|uniref:Endoribonuclease MazF n=1 Tax=Staphylococcus microti TaxID=569857 RepID=A0A0D6XTD6_9STAP|nr:type II toxin-antitoxin system PemK/MazF family toxin [Staphylococcus microti]KIX91710.1 growth inhibitor PemK [Staphylococcus microti]PNZ84322.1 type II toxin-antitoxin system PemK/MazF family toxin [Staphylococcus microti]SUM56782.1 pemK-like family protein [Staphylococcus microti]